MPIKIAVIDKQGEMGYTALIWAIKGLKEAEGIKAAFYLRKIETLLQKGAERYTAARASTLYTPEGLRYGKR